MPNINHNADETQSGLPPIILPSGVPRKAPYTRPDEGSDATGASIDDATGASIDDATDTNADDSTDSGEGADDVVKDEHIMYGVTLRQHIEHWIGENTELVVLAQKIARLVSDSNLIDPMRRLPFEMQPSGKHFQVGVHLDHPVLGHWWINVISQNEFEFLPWVSYWYNPITVETLAQVEETIGKIKRGDGVNSAQIVEAELASFNDVEAGLEARSTQIVNRVIDQALTNYHQHVDEKLAQLKSGISLLSHVYITNPNDGASAELSKLGGKYDMFLLSDPCVISVRTENGEPDSHATDMIANRVREFQRWEAMRSAPLYAMQKAAALAGYTVEVSNDSPLLAKTGKFVKISKEGEIQIQHVLLARYIQVHSPLGLLGKSSWMA